MRCVIFTAYLHGPARQAYTPLPDDYVLCADGGYAHAMRAGVTPQLVIGDCDGGVDIPPQLLRRAPVEKDDTDTMLCLRHAICEGYRDCLLIGGIGGRLDHTYANIQALAFAHAHGARVELRDANERVFLLENGARAIPREQGRALSIFSYSPRCEGVYESGVKYPLENATLTNAFPLGVSNTITALEARVSVHRGILLVILSRLDRGSD